MPPLRVYPPLLFAADGRPYAVFQSQNLGLFFGVLSVLLLAVLIMAVCVYKPLRSRS